MTKKTKAPQTKNLVLSLIILFTVPVVAFVVSSHITIKDMINAFEAGGAWSPLIYITTLALTQIIAPLSNSQVFEAGEHLFGNKAQVLNYISTVLTSTLNFFMAREIGRPVLTKLLGGQAIDRIDKTTDNVGDEFLILFRLLQGHLNDFVSYAFGLTNMKYTTYITISIVTSIPWILLWKSYVLIRLREIIDPTFWFIANLIPLFVIIGFLSHNIRRKLKSRRLRNKKAD